jgi:hypothetical protein
VRRILVLALALVFVTGLAFLTYRTIVEQGFTLASLLSIFIVVLLGVGIIGALRQPPR